MVDIGPSDYASITEAIEERRIAIEKLDSLSNSAIDGIKERLKSDGELQTAACVIYKNEDQVWLYQEEGDLEEFLEDLAEYMIESEALGALIAMDSIFEPAPENKLIKEQTEALCVTEVAMGHALSHIFPYDRKKGEIIWKGEFSQSITRLPSPLRMYEAQ